MKKINTLYILTKLSKLSTLLTYDKALRFDIIDWKLYCTAGDGRVALRLEIDDVQLKYFILEQSDDARTFTLGREFYQTAKSSRVRFKPHMLSHHWNQMPNVQERMIPEVIESVENIDVNLELVHKVTDVIKDVRGIRRLYTNLTLQGKLKPIIGYFNQDDKAEFFVVMPLKLC